MKSWKKLLLGLLALLLLSQIPFTYRRYKLGRLNAAIQQLNSQRTANNQPDGYIDHKGVIHVHSFLGGHSSGGFAEIITAARTNELHFVVMTEHAEKDYDTSAMTLKDQHAGILFVNGNEVKTREGDRLLLIPGDSAASIAGTLTTEELLKQSKARGELVFIAYPEEFKGWSLDGFTGVEVYNLYTNARTINPIVAFCDSLWSYWSYHDLLFATFYRRPSEGLHSWDAAGSNQPLVAIAGNDAHANIGLSLNDSAGNTLVGLKLDPYETSFRLVRVHVLVPREQSFQTTSLLEALSAGHCFIGFDIFGDSSGFNFVATSGTLSRIQGDEIPLLGQVRFEVTSPLPGRIVLFKDGKPVEEQSSVTTHHFVVSEKGRYRIEVYLTELGSPAGEQPWIISNAIYVR